MPYLQKSGIPMEQIDREQLASIAGILKDNLVILSDIDHYLGIFYDGKFSYEDGAKAILSDPKNRETLQSSPRHSGGSCGMGTGRHAAVACPGGRKVGAQREISLCSVTSRGNR